jgi:hypothetical protein
VRSLPSRCQLERRRPVPTGCEGSGPVLRSARLSSKLRAGDRGRTDDLVLGKRCVRVRHVIGRHQTLRFSRVRVRRGARRVTSSDVVRGTPGGHRVHRSLRIGPGCSSMPLPERRNRSNSYAYRMQPRRVPNAERRRTRTFRPPCRPDRVGRKPAKAEHVAVRPRQLRLVTTDDLALNPGRDRNRLVPWQGLLAALDTQAEAAPLPLPWRIVSSS